MSRWGYDYVVTRENGRIVGHEQRKFCIYCTTRLGKDPRDGRYRCYDCKLAIQRKANRKAYATRRKLKGFTVVPGRRKPSAIDTPTEFDVY